MVNLQSEFIKFNDKIKFDEIQPPLEKREILSERNLLIKQPTRFIAIFKNKANSRRNGTTLSSQKAKRSEKHVGSRS